MVDVQQIANSPIIWVCSTFTVVVVILQSWLYFRLAKKNAIAMGVTDEEQKIALRAGIISSLGPAIACFVALIGLMTTIGGPIAWLRLSVIGSAPTELASVTAATTSMGITGAKLGDSVYTLEALAVTWWTLALNGCGWLIFCAFFADKLENIREKVGNGDTKLLGVISGATMIGIFSFLVLFSIRDNNGIRIPNFVAAIGSGIAMLICSKISVKYPKLKEYNLGIAIIVGLACGMITA